MENGKKSSKCDDLNVPNIGCVRLFGTMGGDTPVWQTFNDKRYIAGIDPIPMPDGEMPKAEHVVVIKGARGEYEAVTKSNVEIIIEKYRHVLTPEHIKDLRESVNDTNAEQMGIMEEAVASFNPRLIVM